MKTSFAGQGCWAPKPFPLLLSLLALVHPCHAKLVGLAATPIGGAATDCSEPTHFVELADDVRMKYVVRTPTSSPATLTAEMEFDVEAWVSFGWSADDKGKMIGSEAIIGLPLQPSGPANPAKYHMFDEKVEGVLPFDMAEQTLTDAAVWQEGGKTYLRFTKKLEEPDEIPINSEGLNYWMWAYGFENELGLHDKKTGTGAFSLSVTSCTPPGAMVVPVPRPTPTTPVPPPVGIVVPAPTAGSPVPPPDEEKDKIDESVPEKEVEDSETVDPPTVLDCSNYQHVAQIAPKLTMYYVVNAGENGDASGDTISVKLEYQGNAWLALGVAETAEGKMIGSESVIALPDVAVGPSNPGEYRMVSEENEGVFLMEGAKQTLSGGSIVQEGGTTIVEFKKLLREEGKLGMTVGEELPTTLLWAYGYSNDLNLHKATGAFRLTLNYCSGGTNEIAKDAFTSLNKYTAESRRRMWTSHAILGLLAWAVLAPTAIASSWLRKLLSNYGGLWFKIHMYANILVIVLTVVSFALAIVLVSDENKSHFVGTHEAMGLAIMLLATFQSTNGFFRPKTAPKDEIANTSRLSALVVNHNYHGRNQGSDDELGSEISWTPPPPPLPGVSTATPSPEGSSMGDTFEIEMIKSASSSPSEIKKTKIVRTVWETLHKMLGYFLLFIGLWQVSSGIELYAAKFGTPNLSYVYWWCIGAIASVVLALTVYVRVKEVK
mmetsp:Transcript_21409/g.50508  ORF Transcript_21409/g.50508 Transcript_21409/m.50508 type:complete len:716 (-) Transcript_21409:256-2403(-)|eukprot:CAMPEP_0185808862 /NCGR_PEP_ID=MMETSP1322-20130828/5862_1 /TAXON_ID=265543 /ORGANISM="Minutocellus polymorphus, Strain RCC2270" /LENGTH=715 /DNA_ID=CAMNT_0028505105 /DNA_START=121 /DNA_END=2268 /DNA_ORIENTATION=-